MDDNKILASLRQSKITLDNPKKIKYFANNGYEFAINHYTYEVAGEYINKVLNENNVI